MGLLLVALETLRYIDMNFVVYEHFPIFSVGFLLEIGTGFWATKVSALRYGVLGGAVLGLTWSLIEGFILPMLGMSQDDQVVTLLINTVVIGAIFGLLGGLPVWLRRFGWRWSWIGKDPRDVDAIFEGIRRSYIFRGSIPVDHRLSIKGGLAMT
jgi:uncharacterized membrane protein YeaQ/YmgE (transglycosylase-associated protein family)